MRRAVHLMTPLILLMLLVSGAAAQETTPEPQPEEPALLSAFFGLDNDLPLGANRLCRGSGREDGMPVIFSAEIDPESLHKEDFVVATASGRLYVPECVTLDPATDTGELRTVLLTGELGEVDGDAPVQVRIVGEILGLNDPDVNFLGARVDVTPLEAGPFLVLAERVPETQWSLDQRSGRQQGDGCPSEGTVQIVRVTWAGGVTLANGDEAGDDERALYEVTLVNAEGEEDTVTPFALADIGDGDNNHLLCLDVDGEPVSVFFPEGSLYDPNHDTPNPDTTIAVNPLPEADE
ncbi:MAG: hypothetical protein OHK0046_21610 [Anaerolineae bacterium]